MLDTDDDPYTIEYKDARLFADLAAERTIAAERAGRKIAVEIKSFRGPSPMRELEVAVGQYKIYASLLKVTDPERGLYLAVSDRAHKRIFRRPSVQLIMQDQQVSVLVVNINTEEVTQWIS